MPLALAGMGVPMMIQRVGGNPAMRQHLADLGFVPGSEVTVISTLGGNMIVSVKECRIAISNEMAMKIMV